METINIAPTTEGYLNIRMILRQQIQSGNTSTEILDALVEVEVYLKAIGEL